MIGALALALTLTVPVRPAQPTVGSVITLDFSSQGKSVALDPLPAEVELVSNDGATVRLRAFSTGRFVLSGVVNRGADAIRFRNLPVEVRSVLKADDDLRPAPLVPPKPLESERLPWILVGVAALLAVALWWWLLAKRAEREVEAAVSEAELLKLLREWPAGHVDDPFLARLSDATRRYLSARDARVADSMTTGEILSKIEDGRASRALSDILQLGDRAKFAPWGAGAVDEVTLREEAASVAEERESA